jgi:PAS domain S-box-containing protein
LEQTVTPTQHIFELVNDSVMTRTMDGIINFWNHSAEELYGWRKEEAIGRASHDLLQTQFPKPLKEIESELVRTGRWEGKLVHTTRDGCRVAVESRWTLDLAGQPGAVVEINKPSTDCQLEPGTRTETYRVEVGRQEPLSTNKSVKADDLLARVANIVLGAGAFLCILVLFYLVYWYGWTAVRHFSAPFDMVLYWIFPAVLASLLFGFLWRSAEFKVNAAIVCVSIVALVYAMELLLHLSGRVLFTPESPFWAFEGSNQAKQRAKELAKRYGVEFDTREGFEVIADLRDRGIDVVPYVSPGNHLLKQQPDGTLESAIKVDGNDLIPLSGIANKITLLCNENGSYVTYESDEQGFNNPHGLWRSGRIDIAALGDSFTHGFCVPPEKNFVALIRQRHPETINLGMAGNGPLLMLAALSEYLPQYRPKTVLWFYYEQNDLTDLQTEKKSPLLLRYLEDNYNQGLATRQNSIDQLLMAEIERQRDLRKEMRLEREEKDRKIVQEFARFARLSAVRTRLGATGADPKPSHDLELFLNILAAASSRVSAWGGKLYFVYLPTWGRYANILDPASEERTRVLSSVRALGVSIIDLHPVFAVQSDPLALFPFRQYGHYNEKGHELVAEKVLNSISETLSVDADKLPANPDHS